MDNRERIELEKMIGFFNETIVLRSQLSEEQSFGEFIQQIKETTSKAFLHKNVPFDKIVDVLHPERHGSSNPIFQTMFLYNNINTNSFQGLNFSIEEKTIDLGVSKFDLTLFVNEHQNYLEFTLEFSLDLFKEKTVQQMLRHLEVLLESISQNPNQLISKLSLLEKNEKNEILIQWNKTEMALPNHLAIHHLIEEMAEKFPSQKAVIFQNNELTYQQLDEKANAVAAILIANAVEQNSPVGLFTNRSVEMIIGIVGILKAGAAYLPLDPEYPMERIEFMVADSGTDIILLQEKLKPLLQNSTTKLVSIDNDIEKNKIGKTVFPKINSNQLAYIIYTSGSTGKPKGVPISHQNLIHSTSARFSIYPSNPDCFLLLSSFSFDSSVTGIFWTLCTGGTLLIPKKRIEQDVYHLGKLIETHQVTHTLMLPSLYQTILQHIAPTQLFSLKNIMVAGEACQPILLDLHFKLLPQVELYNEYGPTEASVWCIAHRIQKEDKSFVPIGKAIPNAQVFILNKKLQPVPIGVVGELFIGGLGLSKGYLNRPELTAERFLEFSFLENKKHRIYKTGDLARFHSDGRIEFLGRVDQQVKIRGHRIELEEIQNAILQFKDIRECIVMVFEENNEFEFSKKRLVAYISDLNKKSISELRFFLQNLLPDYMIPSIFIPLQKIPRLPNGKINRNALPSPNQFVHDNKNELIAPKTELEKQLVQIWESVLKIKNIGIQHNYFEIGGDSLRSIQVIAKAREAGIEIAPHHIFEYQTIQEISNFLQKEKEGNSEFNNDDSNSSSLVLLNKKTEHSSLFCIHSGGGHVFFYQPLAQKLDHKLTLYALQPKEIKGISNIQKSIEDMASFYIHNMRKVQPTGPFHLLGTCFSNAVVLEMSHQLKKMGEKIGTLIIVDSAPLHLFGNEANNSNKTFTRFFDLLKRGDFYQIKRKLTGRIFPSKRKKLVLEIDDDESRQHLKSTISDLNNIYANYNWKPFDGSIHFIRSSEFDNRSDKKYHLKQWKKLAEKDLKIQVTEGHHLTLFKEPEVEGLSKCIKKCMEIEVEKN